jgi:hypothetical protein
LGGGKGGLPIIHRYQQQIAIKKLLKCQQGITLIESLGALILLIAISSTLMAVYWGAGSSLNQINNISEMQYASREAGQLMVKDIKSSESVQVLDLNGQPTAAGEAGGQLRLTVPLIDDKGIEYQVVCYYMQNNTLYRERFKLNDKRNSGDDQFLDKIPAVDKIIELSFFSPQYGVVEYHMIAGENGRSFASMGKASTRVHYGLE